MEKNIKKVLTTEAQTITDVAKNVDYDIIKQIIKRITTMEGKLIVSGSGTSGVAAKKIVHAFSCMSIPSIYLHPSDAVHGSLGIIQKGDIVVLISKGGNTEELIKLIPSIEKNGALIIGVGENKESYIGQNATIFLKIITEKEPDPFNMLATASTLAVISIFDAIAIEIMQVIGLTKEQFGINHPGGAVGKRLLGENNII